MGGVHEIDLPSASAGLLHPWLKVLSQEDGLLSGVLLDRLLGWDGDGPGLAPPQSQSVLDSSSTPQGSIFSSGKDLTHQPGGVALGAASSPGVVGETCWTVGGNATPTAWNTLPHVP